MSLGPCQAQRAAEPPKDLAGLLQEVDLLEFALKAQQQLASASPKSAKVGGATLGTLAMGQKCLPKMGCPGKGNQRLKPAIPWWL